MSAEKKQRAWGTDTYSKWDNLDSDDDGADAEDEGGKKNSGTLGALSAATQFNLGASSAVISDVDLLEKASEKVRAQAKRISSLPQRDKEVWQVVVRKLRVWSASSKGADQGRGAIPCRPHAIFVMTLYPKGGLLSQQVCSPCEDPATSMDILEHLFSVMLNPSTGAQRRPGKLVFPDDVHVGALFKAMQNIKVEVSQLSEADGIDGVVSVFSNFLVKKDIANVGPTSEKPGILTGAGVLPGTCKAAFTAFRSLFAAHPWKKFHERQAIKLRFSSRISAKNNYGNVTKVEPTTVWAGIFGHDDSSGNGDGDSSSVMGIQVYFSRLDLEARLTPPGHKAFRPSAHREPRCSYTNKTAAEASVKSLKRTKPRKFDIRSGEELQYASADALRSHWPDVKKHARPLTERDEGIAKGRKRWMDEEIAVLFEDQTMLPFDDHDAIEKHDLDLPSDGAYPFAYQLKKGETERASIANLLFLARASRCIVKALPSFAELSKYTDSKRAEMKLELTPEGYTVEGGGKDVVYLEWCPVFMEAEALASLERQKKARGCAADNNSDENQEDENDEEEGEGEGKPSKGHDEDEDANDTEAEGSGCAVS